MKKYFVSMLAVGLSVVLISCETEEDNTIAKAQKCLDQASPNSAAECRGMVGDLQSAASYAIRCAARFIENGLTTAKVADAMSSSKEQAGAVDPAASMMVMISFTSTAQVNLTYADCQKSESASYLYLANLAKIGTAITTISAPLQTHIQNGTTPTQAEIDTALGALAGDPAGQTSLGEAALSIAGTKCANGETDDVCTKINKAIADAGGAGATAQQIGLQLIDILDN